MQLRQIVLLGALATLSAPMALAQNEGPATGFAISTRVSGSGGLDLSSLIGTSLGSPQFVVGYQGSGFSLGLAVGASKASETDKGTGGELKSTITTWQVGPSALINFWYSADRMSRGNVVLEGTYGKVTAKDEFTPASGTSSEQKISGNMLGVRVGVGGDHFFGRHFGLGAEVGFDGTFVSDLKDDDPANTSSTDLSTTGAYGALRATVVF
jgi:hypothetical protein